MTLPSIFENGMIGKVKRYLRIALDNNQHI